MTPELKLIYAIAGATAATLDSTAAVFGLVLAISGVFWLVGRRLKSSGVQG